MAREIISTGDAPGAVGPYSQAVASDGWLFCSGQVALDPSSGELVTGSITAETKQALDNLTAVLTAAGSEWSKVVKTTCYLTDMADFAEFNDAYAAYAGEHPPARATIAVAGLPKGARVEVECIARL